MSASSCKRCTRCRKTRDRRSRSEQTFDAAALHNLQTRTRCTPCSGPDVSAVSPIKKYDPPSQRTSCQATQQPIRSWRSKRYRRDTPLQALHGRLAVHASTQTRATETRGFPHAPAGAHVKVISVAMQDGSDDPVGGGGAMDGMAVVCSHDVFTAGAQRVASGADTILCEI